MRQNQRCLIAILLLGLWPSLVEACDKFKPVRAEDQVLLEALRNEKAQASQRLFALVELACNSEPTIRKAALDAAIKSSDRSLRSKALAELIMQREGIRAKLEPIVWFRGYARDEVERAGWSINFRFHERSRERNCINLTPGREPCFQYSMLVIDGTQVRINEDGGRTIAEFTLDKNNLLKGFVTFKNNPSAPATVELFQQ